MVEHHVDHFKREDTESGSTTVELGPGEHLDAPDEVVDLIYLKGNIESSVKGSTLRMRVTYSFCTRVSVNEGRLWEDMIERTSNGACFPRAVDDHFGVQPRESEEHH